MAVHSFDPEIAAKVGINAAVIYHNLVFWCEKNRANERHIHEGKAWTYNSMKAFGTLFPYLSADQIRRALERLVEVGLVEKGNFNTSQYDRTSWYCCPSHSANLPNGNGEKAQPIPDSKPDIKPDNSIRRASRLPDDWVPEPLSYFFEVQHRLTPEYVEDQLDRFRDYWKAQPGAKGRKLDWQATWRNWLRNSRNFKSSKPNRHQADMEWLANYVKEGDNEQT